MPPAIGRVSRGGTDKGAASSTLRKLPAACLRPCSQGITVTLATGIWGAVAARRSRSASSAICRSMWESLRKASGR